MSVLTESFIMFALILNTTLLLLSILLLLLSVAFFTLFERKVIRAFHQRLGPNKLSVLGLIQPLADALKLFLKASFTPRIRRAYLYHLRPILALYLRATIFILLPRVYKALGSTYSILLFICLRSVSVLFMLFRGWASNSKYTFLGSLRGVAQSISYEAVFSTLILSLIALTGSYGILGIIEKSSLLFLVFFPLWLVCFLGETHRAPFDFREAESELVSGFNTEYRGRQFAFLFLREYVMVLFGGMIMSDLFILGPLGLTSYLCISLGTIGITFIFT